MSDLDPAWRGNLQSGNGYRHARLDASPALSLIVDALRHRR
ncbi:hypothetical protein [Burkholderia sp. BCC0419]|nr:hypothetical protein [Burkholderia sp. BCC0419]